MLKEILEYLYVVKACLPEIKEGAADRTQLMEARRVAGAITERLDELSAKHILNA